MVFHTLALSIISDLKLGPGIDILLMWFGCFYTLAFTDEDHRISCDFNNGINREQKNFHT